MKRRKFFWKSGEVKEITSPENTHSNCLYIGQFEKKEEAIKASKKILKRFNPITVG